LPRYAKAFAGFSEPKELLLAVSWFHLPRIGVEIAVRGGD